MVLADLVSCGSAAGKGHLRAPLTGDNFYRLVQTDFDGKYKIFSTVHVKINPLKGITNTILGINPSPFKDNIKIEYSLKESGAVEFMIISQDGKIVKSETSHATEGFSSFSFDNLSALSAGIYFIIMMPENGVFQSRKIVNFSNGIK